MKQLLARALVLGVACASVACEASSSDGERGPPITEVPERRVVEVLRLGGAAAPEEVSFQSEPQVALDQFGAIYVLHAQQGRVVVLDSTGQLIRWIGRRGSGPGEFEMAAGLGFVEDTLWVRNFPTPRISRFLIDGTHVSTDATNYEFGYRLTAPSGISGYLRGGRAWAFADAFVMGQDTPIQLPFLVGDREMSQADTLFTAPNPRGQLAGLRFEPIPQPPFHAVAPTGDRIAVMQWNEDVPGVVVVRTYTPPDMEPSEWTLDFPPAPLSTEIRDSLLTAGVDAIEQLAERLRAQGIPEGSFRATISTSEVEAAVYLPAYYPPVRSIQLGHDGTIWIETADQLEDGPWLVLDGEGNPLFRADLPEGATVRVASESAIWATDRDSLDVPYLVHYTLRQ